MALEWYEKAYKKGNVKAMVSLAKFYLYGWVGVERNPSQAMKLYTQAATVNDKIAMYHLGEMYYLGVDVAQHLDKAQQWFAQSATLTFSKMALAYMYHNGIHVQQNSAEAKKLLLESLKLDWKEHIAEALEDIAAWKEQCTEKESIGATEQFFLQLRTFATNFDAR